MLQGYELLEALGTTAGSRLCRARRLTDQQPVLLKLLDDATPEQLARFQREYELLKALHLPGVVRPIALASDGRGSVMVLEDHEGPRLESALAVPLALPRALRLAVQLAQALAGLHEAQVIHRDLRPANLLVDVERARLFIVDLSRASARAASTLDSDGGGAAPDGDLAYVSPEQTGRVRSPVDHRSDLYGGASATRSVTTPRSSPPSSPTSSSSSASRPRRPRSERSRRRTASTRRSAASLAFSRSRSAQSRSFSTIFTGPIQRASSSSTSS